MFKLKNVFYLVQMMVLFPLLAFSADNSDVTTETMKGRQTKTAYTVKVFPITKKGKTGRHPEITYKAYFFKQLHIKDMIPLKLKSENGRPVKTKRILKEDIILSNTLIITAGLVPNQKITGDSTIYTNTIKPNDIPPMIREAIGNRWKDIQVATNNNIFQGVLASGKNGEISRLFEALKIDAGSFFANGAMKRDPVYIIKSGKASMKMNGQEVTDKNLHYQEFIKGFSFAVEIPELAIKELNKLITFKDISFGFNGSFWSQEPWKSTPKGFHSKKDANTISLYFSATSELKLLGGTYDTSSLISYGTTSKESKSEKTLTVLNAFKDQEKFRDIIKIKKLNFLKNIKLQADGGIQITLDEKKNQEKTTSDIDIKAFSGMGINGKEVAFTADFIIEPGEDVYRLNYIELTDNLTLKDINSSITVGNQFSLTDVKIYMPYTQKDVKHRGGIKATSKFLGVDNTVYLFDLGSSGSQEIVFGIKVADVKAGKNFNLGQLAKAAGFSNKTITDNLKTMGIANGAIILSSKNIKIPDISSMPDGLGKDMFTSILGKSNTPLDLGEVTFVSDFDAALAGDIGTLLTAPAKVGVQIGIDNDNTYILGSVGGLFSKSEPFILDLEFLTAGGLNLKNIVLPDFFKHKPETLDTNTKEGIFLKVIDGAAEVGLISGFGFKLEKKDINFTGTLGAQLEEDDIGLSLTGSTDTKIKNVAGIDHFDISGITVNTTIGGDVSIGLSANTEYIGRTMTVTENIVLDNKKGIPEGFGFKLDASRLDKKGWKLANYTTILAVPTFAGFTGGVITGGLTGGAAVGAVGAVVGGVVDTPTACVPGALVVGAVAGAAGVAGGAVAGGVIDTALGVAAGILVDALVPASVMDGLTDAESFLLKADEAYFSFATANAANADLKLPEGIHFNMNNVKMFNHKLLDISPGTDWFFAIENDLKKAVDGIETIEEKMKEDFKLAEQRLKQDIEKLKRKAEQEGHTLKQNFKKEALKDFKFTEVELTKAKNYVTIIAQNFAKLLQVMHYELGLSTKKPDFKYTKPSAKEIAAFKTFFNGIEVENFPIGPFNLQQATIDLIPHFKLASSVKLFGKAKDDIEIGFADKDNLYFANKLSLHPLGEVDVAFDYDVPKDDFEVEGVMSPDNSKEFENWLNKEIKEGIKELVNSITADWNALDDDLKNLEDDIKDLGNQISHKLSEEEQAFEHSKAVQNAKRDWNAAKSDFNSAKSKCRSRNKAEKFLGTRSVCGQALYEAEKAGKSIEYIIGKLNHYLHMGLQVPGKLESKLKDVKTSVAKANGYTDALSKLNSQSNDKKAQALTLTNEISSVGNFNGFIDKIEGAFKRNQFITVKEAIFAGDYKDYSHHKDPFVLMLKYRKLNAGKDTKDYFAFKPNDPDFIKESFALLPVTILDAIISEYRPHSRNVFDQIKIEQLKKAQQWFEKKVHDQISKIKARQLAHIKESKASREKYEKLLDTYDKNLKNFKKSFDAYSKRYDQAVLKSSMTDMMPPSKTFENRYLAVGHSSLCLGVASNGRDVYQENCKDVQSERWTAKPLGNGYVQLKSKGLCLKAKTNNNTSGQPLELAQCDKDNIHEQWKVISRDLFFDSIVNRYSEKCLHFDSENANPRTAYATWTNCIGADSQTFRDISDAERPTVHAVEDRVEAKSGSCLSTKKSFDQYFKKNKKGHLITTRKVYNEMIRKKDDVLVSATCDKDIEDKFNYVEQVNGDIKLVHAQSGWCVAPKSKHSDELVLEPCNKDKVMLWRNIGEGDRFEMRNTETNKCITLDTIPDHKNVGTAKSLPCTNNTRQEIKFVK